jgi:TonB family protein
MLRLFKPPTREAAWLRHPLTGMTLLLHLLVVGLLLLPFRNIVTSPLLDREMVYLVPPDQKGDTRQDQRQLAFDAPAGAAGAAAKGPVAAGATEEVPAAGKLPDASSAEQGAARVPSPEPELAVSELEVDSAVVRDPLSAAPAYPPALLAKGIMGYARVRYVVDTLGAVDTLSYQVVTATHADFAVAVRRALPHMRFRPAIQQGNKVRQWVEQTFHFRIVPPDTTGTEGFQSLPSLLHKTIVPQAAPGPPNSDGVSAALR